MADPTTDADTVPVSFEVLAVERVHGRSTVAAVAVVSLLIDGAEIAFQGFTVRRKHGHVEVRVPEFRCPISGDWLPAVVLPPEIEEPIGRAILAAEKEMT